APNINAGDQHLAQTADAAWAALERANRPSPAIFFRAGCVVRLETDETGASLLRALDADRLCHHIARVAIWTKHGKPAYPPMPAIRDMPARPNPPLPILEHVVTPPVLPPDRRLPERPGYDAQSRLLSAPPRGFTVPSVSQAPTATEIADARNLLVDDLLDGFP